MLLALSLFSEWAMVAVLLLVMTGMINAATILLGGMAMMPGSIWRCLAPSWCWSLACWRWRLINRFRLMPRADNRGHCPQYTLGTGAWA